VKLLTDPRVRELLISLVMLLGSYLAARFVSFVFGKMLTGAASRTATSLDDRLVAAFKRPLTYALVLVGAYAAIHRSPLPARWSHVFDQVLFVLSVLLLAAALFRLYGIALAWYLKQSRLTSPSGQVLAEEFGPLFSKVGTIVIVLITAITILKHFGHDFTSLVVSLGVGSLAVGLAAQDTLANMFAGFTLMLDRPFKVGDRIQLASGEVGDVETIGIRSTRLRTPEETMLIVPNGLLVKERLVNLSQPTHALTTRVDVGVAYGSDLAQVRRILADAARASEHVDRDRDPVVLVTRFGDFAIAMRVVFWAKDYREQALAASQIHEEIYRRLREAGIEIPLPTSKVVQEGPA
jgi:small-conductance mechanosensitive channel